VIEYSCYVVAIERIPEVDTTTAVVIVVIVLAALAVGLLIRFRQRGRIELSGPFGTGLKAEGSNDNPQSAVGIRAKNIVSRDAGVVADDATGRGVDVADVNAKADVLLSSRSPQPPDDPKSSPPA
jgi:hypothetical protein